MSGFLQIAEYNLAMQNFGNYFILLTAKDKEIPLQLIAKAILDNKPDYIDEVIGTQVEICLKLNSSFSNQKLRELETIKLDNRNKISTYKLPVFFNEEADWKTIERHCGLTRTEYITQLLASKISLAMLGFLPGFLYLTGLPDTLMVPRKDTPSKRVDPGSIAIGNKYMGLYSLASPGGWHIIGRTPIKIFDVQQLPLNDIKVGDEIKMVEITQQTYIAMKNTPLNLKEYNEFM